MGSDDVVRYLAVFEKLRRARRWSTDTTSLRLAALSLAAADLDDPAHELEVAADALRERAGWFGSSVFKSSVRYAVAALILRNELSPVRVHDRVADVRKTFREVKLRRGGLSETLAALILVLQTHGRVVPRATVVRLKQILQRWNEDHPWITGTDDYPMAALHAHRSDSPESVAHTVETIYQDLRSHRYGAGNALQLASHILSLASGSGSRAARRFRDIAAELKQRRERTGSGRYDEIALLALLSGSPSRIAESLVTLKAQLRAARPRPSSEIAFSLATGLLMAREVGQSAADGADIATINAARAVLDAQTAAMAAVIAATSASTAAAAAAG